MAEIILRKNPGNKADLKNPDIAVIVEVIRGICLLSIAPNYYKFKKYNLFEICNKGESIKNKVRLFFMKVTQISYLCKNFLFM